MTDFFAAQLEREAIGTRRALERVPEGRNDWKPHAKSMSLGYLAARLLVGGRVVSEQPRYISISDAVLAHLAHHRGQLTVYLRLLDAPVPAIYGPSADEGHFG